MDNSYPEYVVYDIDKQYHKILVPVGFEPTHHRYRVLSPTP